MAMGEDNHQDNPERSGGASDERLIPSTRYEWRKVKMSRSAGGQQHSAPKGRRFFHLPPWDWRRPTTVTMKYRGGAEGWIEVRARGSLARYPGYVQLIDVLGEITRQQTR